MTFQTAYSTRSSAREAAAEIEAGLQTHFPKMVLFFASSNYPPEETAREIGAAFPGATIFDCSTAGEIVSGQMLKNSIVAMAFNAAVIQDVRVEVLTDVRRQAVAAVARAFAIPIGDPDRVCGRKPADRRARDLCHGTPYRRVREPRVRIDTTCTELPAISILT